MNYRQLNGEDFHLQPALRDCKISPAARLKEGGMVHEKHERHERSTVFVSFVLFVDPI